MNEFCPGPDALERLLDDRLGWLEEEELNRHIEGCAPCRSWLDERLADQLPAQFNQTNPDTQHGTSTPQVESATDPRPSTLLQQALTRLHDARQSVLAGVFPQVDGYEFEALLGRGASGVVYRARHKRLGRTVAIKLAPEAPELTDSQRQRFRQEAEALAQLQHPNIVQVFDVGEAGSRPWFAMEYVHGVTLARRIDGRPQDPRSATLLVACLARAIACAHAAGILHRDLKPSNILLEEQTGPGALDAPWGLDLHDRVGSHEEGRPAGGGVPGRRLPLTPKVIDFGLVRRLDPADRLTVTHEILGTPGYMAPEQARSQNDNLGPTTDVYALGAILYELLTGRPPFRRATAIETLLASSFELPVAPSRLEPAVSRDLETICLKCLEKEPRLRFASAGELADELERVATNRPIESRPPGAWGRFYRLCLRNPGHTALGGLVALLLLLGIWGAGLFLRNEVRLREEAVQASTRADEQRALAIEQRHVAEAARHQAELQRQRADDNLRLAQSYLARSAEMLAPESNSPDEVTVDGMRLREELEQIAADLQADFAQRQPEEGELALARAEALRRTVYWQQLRRTVDTQDPDDSLEVLREALQLVASPEAREKDAGRADLLRLRIQTDLVRHLYRRGEQEARPLALSTLGETRRLLDIQPGQEHLLLLLCDLHHMLAQFTGPPGELIAGLREGRAEVLARAGDRPPSKRLYEHVLLMWRSELLRYQSQADHARELATLREIHAFLKQVGVGTQSGGSLAFIALRTQSELGRALARLGHWDEAVTVLKEASQPTPRKRVLVEERLNRTLIDHDWVLAEALVQVGQPAEAVTVYHRIIRNAISDPEATVARMARLIPLLQLQQLSMVRSELQDLTAIPRIEGDVALLLAERHVELLDAWKERPGLEDLRDEVQPRVLDLLERALSRPARLRARAAEILARPCWQGRVDAVGLEALKHRLALPGDGTASPPTVPVGTNPASTSPANPATQTLQTPSP